VEQDNLSLYLGWSQSELSTIHWSTQAVQFTGLHRLLYMSTPIPLCVYSSHRTAVLCDLIAVVAAGQQQGRWMFHHQVRDQAARR
jgi:hypothetical protein